MTHSEVQKKIREFLQRRHDIHESVVRAARSVVPVLKDAQRIHSAKELDELLFQLDALDQELTDFCKANPVALIDSLRAGLKE
jgi:predicted translin family RNA/ssDNA-binding protein